MHRSSKFIATSLLLLLILLIALFGQGVLRKVRLDASAQELAVEVTQAVLTERDPTALVSHGHTSLLAQLSPDTLASYITHVTNTLGTLQRIQSITGDSEVPLLPTAATPPSALYTLALLFEYDPTVVAWRDESLDEPPPLETFTAVAEVSLGFYEKRWQITGFMIQSELLEE